MQGVLLDAVTGRAAGRARVPRSSEVAPWAARVERDLALERNRQLLQGAVRVPGLVGTTTTDVYRVYPAAAAGISRATSGGAAWSFSAYTEVVPVNTITTLYNLACVYCHPPAATATATTNEYILEIASGLAGSEVLVAQVGFTVRNVTAAGYIPPVLYVLPEPVQVAANTRLSVRVAYSVLTTSSTVTGIKVGYHS